MDTKRWQQITESFDKALDYPSSERPSFLKRICAGDHDLFSEVTRLLAEFEKASDFLEQPFLAAVHALVPGDLIAGRYRVEGLLGRGGMGEVYRALDELMDERIALKTLRPEFCGNHDLLRRFQREIRLARKVTHPNVCRVFEVGVDHVRGLPLHFFIMQLLEGPTLAARIRLHGPFHKNEALPLVTQMSEALVAAHGVGIVHRDFKSSNVILCEGRAIITDFGLARVAPNEGPLPPAATTTANPQIAGTVAFMSPEQLSGGEVTASSDIYSFGVVLFEMVTGKLPFDDRHIINSAMQRASEVTLNVRGVAPEIDSQWAAVIARCLQRDPSKRYLSAAEIPRNLRAGFLLASSRASLDPPPLGYRLRFGNFRRRAVRFPRDLPLLLAECEIARRCGSFAEPYHQFDWRPAFQRHYRIVQQPALPVGSSHPYRLRETARRAPPDGKNRRYERSRCPARSRMAALNAALTIFGDVSRIGPDYALNIQLETRGSQPYNPNTKKLRSFTASDSDALMRSIRDASLWVRESAGETMANIANFDLMPANATTPSWEALSNYARGQAFFMKQDFEPAILEFEAALRIDPGFTLAAVRRADLLVTQHRQTEGFRQWRAAMAMLDKRPVTRPEELNARGMFALDTGDLETADRYFRTWSVEYPHDWRGPFYRMIPLCMSGHAAEALELLEQISISMPDYGDIFVQMLACDLLLGHTNEARQLLPKLRMLERPERARMREGYIHYREGDCVGYLEILRSIQLSGYRRGAADAMLQEALLLIDAGLPEAAASRTEAFLRANSQVEISGQQVDLRVAQAWAEMLAGRGQAAIDHARQAIQSETGPLVVQLCGTVFVRCGAASLATEALRICSDLQDFPLYRLTRHRILGEQGRARGQLEAALKEFRSAAALEPFIAHCQYLIEALPALPEYSKERTDLSLNVVRNPWQVLRPPPLHHIGAMALALPVVNTAHVAGEPFAKKFAASAKKLAAAV